MTLVIIGILAGLLVASLVLNIAQYASTRRTVDAALQHEERLLDRARGAELRAAQQIDAMLDRLHTTPRMTLAEAKVKVPERDSGKRLYITDSPYMDEAWNDYRGIADEEPADEGE